MKSGTKQNVINNVIDVDYCDFFSKDIVVCSCSDDRMLYNYKTKEILVPSYSSMYSDVDKFSELKKKDYKHIKLVKKIYSYKVRIKTIDMSKDLNVTKKLKNECKIIYSKTE